MVKLKSPALINQMALDVVRKLRAPAEIDAVILFGSHARGCARPDSDVDLLVVVQEGFKQTSEFYQNTIFEITFVTKQATMDWWRKNPDHSVMLWRYAKVLYDRDETGQHLRAFSEQIEKLGKPALLPKEIEKRKQAASYQLVSLSALATQDSRTANFVLNEKMAGYILDYFTVRQMWAPPAKERLPEIRIQDHTTAKILDQFSVPEQPLDRKLNLAKELIEIIFDPNAGSSSPKAP